MYRRMGLSCMLSTIISDMNRTNDGHYTSRHRLLLVTPIYRSIISNFEGVTNSDTMFRGRDRLFNASAWVATETSSAVSQANVWQHRECLAKRRLSPPTVFKTTIAPRRLLKPSSLSAGVQVSFGAQVEWRFIPRTWIDQVLELELTLFILTAYQLKNHAHSKSWQTDTDNIVQCYLLVVVFVSSSKDADIPPPSWYAFGEYFASVNMPRDKWCRTGQLGYC